MTTQDFKNRIIALRDEEIQTLNAQIDGMREAMASRDSLKTKVEASVKTPPQYTDMLRRFYKADQLNKANFKPGPALIIYANGRGGSGEVTIETVTLTHIAKRDGRVHYRCEADGRRSTVDLRNVRIECEDTEF